jgi:hypothetical protein
MAKEAVVTQMAEYIAKEYPIKGKMRLLTPGISNTKTAKSSNEYITAILHLAPSWLSGYNTCPMATEGCRKACLATAGRNSMKLDEFDINRNRAAQIRKTQFFYENQKGFMAQLVKEIESIVKKAEREGKNVAIRLNGTSDIRWENINVSRRFGKFAFTYVNLMYAFPNVQFYDYTKIANRKNIPSNYYLIFSASENNEEDCKKALQNGMNVAVVFSAKPRGYNRYTGIFTKVSEPLPIHYWGYKVEDGDKSDLRFSDDRGVIIGLRVKGRAALDKTGFVKNV